MMPPVYLALLASPETVPQLLSCAAEIAHLHADASIEVLVMRFEPHATAAIAQSFPSEAGETKIRVKESQRADKVRSSYDAWLDGYRGTSDVKWIDEKGLPEDVMAKHGERAALIVVARPDADGELADHEAVLAAVFASNRPVLIMPKNWNRSFGTSIAVAWRWDKSAPEALQGALSSFPKVKNLHFLIGRRTDRPAPEVPQLPGCNAQIFSHEIQIQSRALPDLLLKRAHELKADLLVVGAATHSTWHIFLYGNVTKMLIAQCELPLLMRGVQVPLA